jgi:hypothetical protein
VASRPAVASGSVHYPRAQAVDNVENWPALIPLSNPQREIHLRQPAAPHQRYHPSQRLGDHHRLPSHLRGADRSSARLERPAVQHHPHHRQRSGYPPSQHRRRLRLHPHRAPDRRGALHHGSSVRPGRQPDTQEIFTMLKAPSPPAARSTRALRQPMPYDAPATTRPGDLKGYGCLDFISTGSIPLDNRGRLC